MRIETTGWSEAPAGRRPDRPLLAIGDIHGYSDALRTLLGHLKIYIAETYGAAPVDLVFLGDLVDRGPDPLGVLELAGRGLQMRGVSETLLLGNHDWYLSSAAGLQAAPLRDREWDAWLRWGGRETLAAMGVGRQDPPNAFRARMTVTQSAALAGMRPSFRSGGIFCAHAGVDPLLGPDDQTQRDLMWMREPFLTAAANPRGAWPFGLTVVHGHTIGADGVYANRIGVDTGGYETGVFSAVEITAQGVRFHRVVRRGG